MAEYHSTEGLVGITRSILLDNMVKHAVGASPDGLLAMVTDAEGRRVLGASLTMRELAQEGVTHIEDLCVSRQPRSDLGAIYFIGPTKSSIDRLLFDFRGDVKMYAQAWVFFTGRVPDAQFAKLRNAGAHFRSALKCCRELFVEFAPLPTLGGRGFTLDVPELTFDMYSTEDARASFSTPARKRAVERLFQLCINLGEVPEIAYFDLDQRSRGRVNEDAMANKDVEQVAMELSARLRDFRAKEE